MYLSIDDYQPIELHSSDIRRYIPEFSGQGTLAEQAREYLDKCREVSDKLINESYHPQQVNSIQCKLIDRMIKHLFYVIDEEVRKKILYKGKGAALLAQGGYGRKEMSLHSDIDLIFIFNERRGPYIENLTERILYLLWDL